MAKKSNATQYIYLLGMVLVLIGCFLPMVSSKLGDGASVWARITSDHDGIVKTGGILCMAGAVAGIVFCFVSILKGGLDKLIALIVSLAGGIYVTIKILNSSGLAKSIGKTLAKATGTHISIGLILIIAGWLIALVGWVMKRD